MTLQEVAKVIEKPKVSAPTIGLPGYIADAETGTICSPQFEPGEYISWPAVQAALTAVGSNSRYDRSNALGNFNQLASQGSFVVNLTPMGADEHAAIDKKAIETP